MCELILYIGPHNLASDHELHPMHFRPGDVIEARHDGWLHPEAKERTNPIFRLLVFPGVDPSEAEHLMASKIRRRDFRINLEHAALTGEKVEIIGVTIRDLTIAHPQHPLHVIV